MAVVIELTDEQWSLVADLFDPPGRRGAPARIERRQMVSAMLFLARTGCKWRYLPDRFGPWGAAWQQWRRWRANGVWERAMSCLARHIRVRHERDPIPSMVMIDAQTVRGGRAGPTFHNAGGRGGRTIGCKRSILVEILGLPVGARVDPAKPHDVRAGRDLLRDSLGDLPRVRAIVADRGYRGLRNLADRRKVRLDIKLRRWAKLASRRSGRSTRSSTPSLNSGAGDGCRAVNEGTEASATAWLEVAAVGYLLGRV